MNGQNKKVLRQESAVVRKAEADTRTPQEQLKRLDAMFGPGLGAKKERAKLAARIAAGVGSRT